MRGARHTTRSLADTRESTQTDVQTEFLQTPPHVPVSPIKAECVFHSRHNSLTIKTQVFPPVMRPQIHSTVLLELQFTAIQKLRLFQHFPTSFFLNLQINSALCK